MKQLSATFLLVFVIFTFTFSTSFAQINWTKYPGSPVLEPGPSGSWDNLSVGAACVILVSDTYHMWYDANWDNAGTGTGGIGHATSNDGINWSKDTLNPILLPTAGSWDSGCVTQATVLFNNSDSLFHMWYIGWSSTSITSYIGHATSPDAGNWTKDTTNNPVLNPGSPGSWDDDGFTGPCVILLNNTFHMWYDGWRTYGLTGIGYATSSDGITWTKYDDPTTTNPPFAQSDPVFRPGTSSAWDYPAVRMANVIFDGFGFHMFYTGGSWFTYDIGYAYSMDGINWTKYSNNSVLQKGPANSWDDYCVMSGSVMFNSTEDSLKMWYTGASNGASTSQIGYATAPVITIHVPGNFPTIQAAIDSASESDIVLVADGTYQENINFKGKAITVASHYYFDGDTSHISNTIIDGSNPSHPDSGSVVSFVSGEDTNSVLTGFTITGGSGTQFYESYLAETYVGGGGIYTYSSGAKISFNKIESNSISTELNACGGGVCAAPWGNSSYIILEDNKIQFNTLYPTNHAVGGGIVIVSNAKLFNNLISSNYCYAVNGNSYGGGVCCGSESYDRRSIIMDGNTITENIAQSNTGGYGGGIEIEWSAAHIKNNVVSHNQVSATAGRGAGVRLYELEEKSILENNIISYNNFASGTGYGGGLLVFRSDAIIQNNIISNNSGTDGGGIDCWGPTTNKANLKIKSEKENSKNYVAVEQSGFGTNKIIMINEHPAQNIKGLYQNDYQPILINNTIVNNVATSYGGGIVFYSNSNPTLTNNIIFNNTAGSGNQVYLYYNNCDPNFFNCDVEGGVGAFAGLGSGASYSGTYQDNIDSDPLFADTVIYNLSNLSPCIGAGIDSLEIGGVWYFAPPFDYNGDPRPNPVDEYVDIGAQESDFPTGIIKEDLDYLPKTFSLKQNYPNPFNPSTTIEFSIPKVEYVTLKIYNLLGQEVSSLVSEKLTPGEYKYTWDASKYASGVYFYKLEAADFIQTKKLILMK